MGHHGQDYPPVPASQLGLHLGDLTVQYDVQTAFHEGGTIATLLQHNPRWSEIPDQSPAAVLDWSQGSFNAHGAVIYPHAMMVTEQFIHEPSYRHKPFGGIAVVTSSFDPTSEFAASLDGLRERLGKMGVLCLIEKQPMDPDLTWRKHIVHEQGFVMVGASHHREWIVTQGRLPIMAHHEPVNLFDRYGGPSGMIWAIRKEVTEQYEQYCMNIVNWDGIDARLSASRFIPHDLKMYRRGYGVTVESPCGCLFERDLLGDFHTVLERCDGDHAELDILREQWVDHQWEKANKRYGYGHVEIFNDVPPPIEEATTCGDCGGAREILTYPIGEVRPDHMRYFRILVCRGDCYDDIHREWYVDVPV